MRVCRPTGGRRPSSAAATPERRQILRIRNGSFSAPGVLSVSFSSWETRPGMNSVRNEAAAGEGLLNPKVPHPFGIAHAVSKFPSPFHQAQMVLMMDAVLDALNRPGIRQY